MVDHCTSHGLALALSPDVPVDDLQAIVHSGRNPQRKWGLQILRTTIAGRDLILANGHVPIFVSRNWSAIVSQDAQVFDTLVDENPDSLVLSLGDRNHLTKRQRRVYSQLHTWGVPLLTDEPTYQLRKGKHRWVAWLGVAEPQLDGIHVRIPEGMELINAKVAADLDVTQVGYEVETQAVASDHLAVRALIQVPASPYLPEAK